MLKEQLQKEIERESIPVMSYSDIQRYISTGMKINEGANCSRFLDTHYLVFEDGRVYNSNTRTFMMPHEKDGGYLRYTINKPKPRTSINIHSLVARVFIPNPNDFKIINHIDGNKRNNRVDNLEWTTHLGNMQHARETGLLKGIPNLPALSKGIIQLSMTGEFIAEYLSTQEAARVSGVAVASIKRCAKGGCYAKRVGGEEVWWNCNSAGGFKWEYKDPLNRIKMVYSEVDVQKIISMVCDHFNAPFDGRDEFIIETVEMFIKQKREALTPKTTTDE